MSFLKRYALLGAWTISFAGMLGSLYFSRIRGFVPCELCWYQRIALFPLVLIVGIALVRKDAGIWRYALPLAGFGWLVAVYHNLLYYGVIAERLAPCTNGVSCLTKYVSLFGFASPSGVSFWDFGLSPFFPRTKRIWPTSFLSAAWFCSF